MDAISVVERLAIYCIVVHVITVFISFCTSFMQSFLHHRAPDPSPTAIIIGRESAIIVVYVV